MPFYRLFYLLFFISFYTYSNEEDYVVAFSSGFSEDSNQTYGISSYETLGKGNWGIYGEMLFSYQSEGYQYCDEQCSLIEAKDRQFNFTVGGSYGFTDNLYGLLGGGVRLRGVSTSPYNNPDVCDPDDDGDDEPVHLPSSSNNKTGEQYCSKNTDIGIAAQVGLLYVTPIGLSIAGTIDTEKTATLSVGYQF